jgi:large subunit ribosomal protein L14e
MPAIEVGREAGEKCVIVEIIDDKFVEVLGSTVKNRRCNIKHLEPLEQVIEIKTEDPEEIKKEFEAAIA